MLLVKTLGRFAAFLVLYIFGVSDHSLIEGIDDVCEADRFDWCRLLPGEREIEDLVDGVPGAAVDDDASEALVEIDISDPLLFVETKDARATQQLAKDEILKVSILRSVM